MMQVYKITIDEEPEAPFLPRVVKLKRQGK